MAVASKNLTSQMTRLLMSDMQLEQYDSHLVILDLIMHMDNVLSPLY